MARSAGAESGPHRRTREARAERARDSSRGLPQPRSRPLDLQLWLGHLGSARFPPERAHQLRCRRLPGRIDLPGPQGTRGQRLAPRMGIPAVGVGCHHCGRDVGKASAWAAGEPGGHVRSDLAVLLHSRAANDRRRQAGRAASNALLFPVRGVLCVPPAVRLSRRSGIDPCCVRHFGGDIADSCHQLPACRLRRPLCLLRGGHRTASLPGAVLLCVLFQGTDRTRHHDRRDCDAVRADAGHGEDKVERSVRGTAGTGACVCGASATGPRAR
jgi:hypothetical protein